MSENETAQKGLAFDKICKGWGLDGTEFTQGLWKDHQKQRTEEQSKGKAAALRQVLWQDSLGQAMGNAERIFTKCCGAPKSLAALDYFTGY